MKVTAVFDIGRTNKKFFLFDKNLQEVYREYTNIVEIQDEDGYPCDNITEIVTWMRKTLSRFLNHETIVVKAVNFSAYGASLVHLGNNGEVLAPIYNYLKPIPAPVLEGFYTKHGDQFKLARETASPPLAMLNSGLQLYWIKYVKPLLFAKIKWSLHLPQYLSYVFTGVPVSDFTSIGCHTFLWNYSGKDYHQWVYNEKIDRLLAPIVQTQTMVIKYYDGRRIKFGLGIHDSSAALLPYFRLSPDPFLLISTGTWSISLNPFSNATLTRENLQNDVLKFMQTNGQPVRSSRLFLGNEYKLQTKILLDHFQKKPKFHHKVKINWKLIEKLQKKYKRKFVFTTIDVSRKVTGETDLSGFKNFTAAYHQLMLELVELQVRSTKMAIEKTSLTRIYIDGGFIDNDIFLNLLATHFSEYKMQTAHSALGSALGAAMVISEKNLNAKALKHQFELKKHKPRKSSTLKRDLWK